MLITTPRCVGALVVTRDDLCRGYRVRGYREVPPLTRPHLPLGIPSSPARCPCSSVQVPLARTAPPRGPGRAVFGRVLRPFQPH